MAELKFLEGDATSPCIEPALIAHVCNNVGGWGAGFVKALSRKSPLPEASYRKWFQTKIWEGPNDQKTPFELGEIQVCLFEHSSLVINMLAQDQIQSTAPRKDVYLDYDALKKCLKKLYKFAKDSNLTVHMPRIGCALAGGKWSLVEPMILDEMTIDTYIYTFGPYNL